MTTNRILLASVHDVSPRFESEVERLTDILGTHVGNRIAMLVVPNHWGEALIVTGSPFAARLRAWANAGIDMFVHGYCHRDEERHTNVANYLRARFMTAGEGEFLGLSRDEAAARIRQGQALIEDVTGRAIAGFVAPAWLYGQGAREALAGCGIAISEDHWRIWSPATGGLVARGPVITWASRTRTRRLASLAAAAALRRLPVRVLRIGVHPPDSSRPSLLGSIDRTLRIATKSRRPARYSDLPLF
jgi:predicted deacetylase